MSPSTAKAKAPQALKLTAALAATSGALHQTLLAVVRGQGVTGRHGSISLRRSSSEYQESRPSPAVRWTPKPVRLRPLSPP